MHPAWVRMSTQQLVLDLNVLIIIRPNSELNANTVNTLWARSTGPSHVPLLA